MRGCNARVTKRKHLKSLALPRGALLLPTQTQMNRVWSSIAQKDRLLCDHERRQQRSRDDESFQHDDCPQGRGPLAYPLAKCL